MDTVSRYSDIWMDARISSLVFNVEPARNRSCTHLDLGIFLAVGGLFSSLKSSRLQYLELHSHKSVALSIQTLIEIPD